MKVAVLFGGTSAERDVSLASGAQVIQALRQNHEVIAVDTAKGVLSSQEEAALFDASVQTTPPDLKELSKLEAGTLARIASSEELQSCDLAFIALHGGSGEDGRVQAFLETAGIRYTGTGVLGSAAAMDKDMAKRLMRDGDVPTAPWIMAPQDPTELTEEFLASVVESLSLPVVVKPSKQGSSVGLAIVKDPSQLRGAIVSAFQFDDEVMLEKFVPGRELTVGVLDGKALACGEIIPLLDEVFDYQSKYQKGGATETFPAEIPDNIADEMKTLALKAHAALKLGNYSRIDFRLTDDGKLFCLEANTVPGMTATSLLPQSAGAEGIGFNDLCERICELALKK